MNADYRAGMMAALKTVIDRTTFTTINPTTEFVEGWNLAMRECCNMAAALHHAARTWDDETEKEPNEN